MKQLFLIITATALLMVPSLAQAQARTGAPQPMQSTMSVSEFRQVLLDFGAYVDARSGTSNIRQRIEDVPLNQWETLYQQIPDPRKLQRLGSAVVVLKKAQAERTQRGIPSPQLRVAPQVIQRTPALLSSNGVCLVIIQDPPEGSGPCAPNYPDPSGPSWSTLAGDIIPTILPVPDVASAINARCDSDEEAALSLSVSTLQALVESASPICNTIPPVANILCWAPVAAVATAGSLAQGFYNDCQEQNGDVNGAQIEATFRNTVTLYKTMGEDFGQVSAGINSIDTGITSISTQVTNENTQINNELSALDTHLTNIDNHVTLEFASLNAQLVSLFNQLSTQITQSGDLQSAYLKQIMKLELTPEGQRMLVPAILTCSGANCPNVLNHCPAAGCSWNNVGPLP